MELLDAINVRCSHRKYLSEPISEAVVRQLKTKIMQYNHQANLNMQIILDNGDAFQGIQRNCGMFSNVQNYIAIMGPTDEVSKEKAGYYGEKIILDATILGLGSCWVGGTFDKRYCICKKENDEEIYCVIAIGNVADKFSFKEKLIRNAMHRKTKSAQELCKVKETAPLWFWSGMEAVQAAPSAINKQPVTFFCEEDRVFARIQNTSGFESIDMGIAKLHFELGAGGGLWQWGNNGTFSK